MASNVHRPGELEGVGGWLTLLILSLIVLGPAFGLRSLGDALASAELTTPKLLGMVQWADYKELTWARVWTVTAISFSAGLALSFFYVPAAKWYAIAALLIAGPVSGAADLLLVAALFGVNPVTPQSVGALVGSSAPNLIWVAYLLRSRRVANTYR